MDDIIKLQTRCVAHEIRNHVSICEMYTEIIKKNLEKAGFENNSVANAIECVKKSLRIISNSLLDLKSLNNLEPKNAGLKSLVQEGVRLSEAYTAGKHIQISCFVKEDAQIYIDENKFLACMVNIIKNGIEAIDDKGEINVIADIKDQYARIRINNNGKMITKEKQKEIFEEGFTTKPTGSGLGLHICRKNLEAQNAELKLNKSTKSLTEFEIRIPVFLL